MINFNLFNKELLERVVKKTLESTTLCDFSSYLGNITLRTLDPNENEDPRP